MFILTLFTSVLAVVNLRTGEIKTDDNFNKEFTSAPDSYKIQALPEASDYKTGNELYLREKCTSCCRVIFASNYNYEHDREFTADDDRNDHIRYVMDMEFDDKRSLRKPGGGYEQNILLRPLNAANELQYFEFAPYNMYTCFTIPKRVHDIRGGANLGSTLIIWSKNPALSNSPGTQNQMFVYVHPYPDSWYPEHLTKYNYYDDYGRTGTITYHWPEYKYHFYLPFRYDIDLCYEAFPKNKARATWTGNMKLSTLTTSYQIAAQICVANEPRQKFIPVYA